MDQYWSVTQQLLTGFGENCLLFGVTLLFALPLGLLISLGSMSRFKPLSALTRAVVWAVRGTPLMLQLLVIYFGPYYIFGISISMSYQFYAVIIAFAINYSAYFAEIYRGGIESIPKGQYEAAEVLGYTKFQTFMRIILPQVIKIIMPSVTNEVITLVKDTALARALSVIEIIAIAYEKVNKYAVLTPLLYAGLFYLAFSGLLTLLFHLLEKKLSYYTV